MSVGIGISLQLLIERPSINCDVCHIAELFPIDESSFTVVKKDYLVAGAYRVHGVPTTVEAALDYFKLMGWASETIHGAEFTFCPKCKTK